MTNDRRHFVAGTALAAGSVFAGPSKSPSQGWHAPREGTSPFHPHPIGRFVAFDFRQLALYKHRLKTCIPCGYVDTRLLSFSE